MSPTFRLGCTDDNSRRRIHISGNFFKQEIEKESLSAASTEYEVPNEVEEMQSVIVPEEEKSDEIVTKDDIVHEHKNEEKETKVIFRHLI